MNRLLQGAARKLVGNNCKNGTELTAEVGGFLVTLTEENGI